MLNNLLIHNILFTAGGVINIVLIIIVIFLKRKKFDTLVVTFILMTLSVAVFQISHVLGVSASSADLSRKIFMFNLSIIFIQLFMTHWFFALTGRVHVQRYGLALVYITGIALLTIHLIFPETYLLDSVPKMYFPFYYQPGNLQWITRVWFHIVSAYYLFDLLIAYRKTIDPVIKNRYLFVLLAILYGFIFGESAVFLVYDIQFDPMWSSLFGGYTILIAYSMIRYQLFDVQIIVQRAFWYAVSISALIVFIIFANSSSNLIHEFLPWVPVWLAPLLSSSIALFIGVSVWNKLRENDLLRYEFITIIAHKFRTPLTQIKWSVEELSKIETDAIKVTNLQNIDDSNKKLIDLTGALIDLSNSENTFGSKVSFEECSLCDLLKNVADYYKNVFSKKKIIFSLQCPIFDVRSNVDVERFKFVIQTLLENAFAYTPNGGNVSLNLESSSNKAYILVSDNGIGINKNNISHIFNRFYRTENAMITDTEGFGVGLFLARSIAKRHGGDIKVYSDGEGKGSTFKFILPKI